MGVARYARHVIITQETEHAGFLYKTLDVFYLIKSNVFKEENNAVNKEIVAAQC